MKWRPSGTVWHTFGSTLPAVHHKKNWSAIISTNITKELRKAVDISGAQVVFKPEDVSKIYMQAGGAMEMLISRVYTDTIRLVGR